MSTTRACLAIALAALLGACEKAPEPTRESVDVILHNGVILTMDDVNSRGTAIAIRGDRIVAIGDEQLLQTYAADAVRDLAGRTLMPGFVDTQVRISGTPARHINLAAAKSIEEIGELVAAKAAELGPEEWITGYGWSENALKERRRPLRSDLDEAAPDNPVVLTRVGGHVAVASSRALALAGIDERTRPPPGATIEKGKNGKLNGILREHPELVTRLVPKATDDELRPSLVDNLRDLLRFGITSIVQTSETIAHYPEWERVYAEHPGNLPRASVQMVWAGSAAMTAFGHRTGDGDEWLKVGAIRLYIDSDSIRPAPARSTRDAAKKTGSLRDTPDRPAVAVYDVIRDAHRAGWQLGIHPVGDAAIAGAVEALADVLAETPRADHRHYLNHFTLIPDTETLALMAENGIAVTQQPNHIYSLEGRYVSSLNRKRLETVIPLRTPMNHGIQVAISSEAQPIGPLVGLYAAVTRKGASGREFGPAEKITMLEALRAYTTTGAWLTHEEALKGTLAPGKLADFIVLSQNPLKAAEEEILSIRVLETWLGGRLLYRNTEPEAPQ